MSKKAINLIGQRFGDLLVIARAENLSPKNPRWLCKCDCGGEAKAQRADLINGRTTSCGCWKKEAKKTHGQATKGKISKAYRVWADMKKRCLNKNNKSYPDYGGRGITVCERWMKFENFYADMGRPNGTIDRIDNEKGYSPDNCKWSTRQEQNTNRRDTVYITFNGITKPRAEWCKQLNINTGTLTSRLKRGWSIDRALTEQTT